MKISKTKNTMVVLLAIFFAVFSTSCGESSKNMNIPGIDGPNMYLQGDTMLISMVFQNLNLEGGLRYNIPKYPNSYVAIEPDFQSSGTLMSISLSLDDVFNDRLKLEDPLSLPGGRALPGVASGTLPAVAFSIEKFNNMTFYIGPKVFGIFIPTKMNIGPSIITARYYSGKIRSGNLSLVGQDANGENSGILLLLDMSSRTKKRLKRIAKRY